MTCAKTQGFLAKHKVTVTQQADAKKATIKGAAALDVLDGVDELYVKDDSVNHPTLSYKDRVVSIAATRAVELGFDVLACASTGNLANSVAAHAARLGIDCCKGGRSLRRYLVLARRTPHRR